MVLNFWEFGLWHKLKTFDDPLLMHPNLHLPNLNFQKNVKIRPKFITTSRSIIPRSSSVLYWFGLLKYFISAIQRIVKFLNILEVFSSILAASIIRVLKAYSFNINFVENNFVDIVISFTVSQSSVVSFLVSESLMSSKYSFCFKRLVSSIRFMEVKDLVMRPWPSIVVVILPIALPLLLPFLEKFYSVRFFFPQLFLHWWVHLNTTWLLRPL